MTELPQLESVRPSLDLSRRDLVVDGVRVLCVMVVVIAHLLLVGVGVDGAGKLVISKPLAEQSWFPIVSVVGQVMPLFFALGGFAAYVGWQSVQKRGGGYADFLRARLLRLVRPSLVTFVFFAVVLAATIIAGIPADVVNGVAAGVGTPLWFLAAFILTQWAAPWMIEAHRRARWSALFALALSAVAVDGARAATGWELIGLLNTAFVWLFAQQLGFFYADGTLRHARRSVLAVVGIGAGGLLWAGVAAGLYSPDMLHNQYPPLFALGLLAVAQMCLLGILRPMLDNLMRARPLQAVTFLVGSRLMTVYLWHLTCIVAVIGVCLVVPGWTPPPASADWWASRPLVLIAALLLVYAVSLLTVRFERGRPGDADGRMCAPWRLHLATAFVFIGPFLVMCLGLDLVLALVSAGGFALALALVRPSRPPR